MRLAVGLERLRLATAAVQREHQVLGELLTRRVLRHEVLQLGHDVAVPAGREVGLQPHLHRLQALLLEPRDLGGSERLGREVGERRSAPQRERLAQDVRGLRGFAVRQRLPAARGRAPRSARRRARPGLTTRR